MNWVKASTALWEEKLPLAGFMSVCEFAGTEENVTKHVEVTKAKSKKQKAKARAKAKMGDKSWMH